MFRPNAHQIPKGKSDRKIGPTLRLFVGEKRGVQNRPLLLAFADLRIPHDGD